MKDVIEGITFIAIIALGGYLFGYFFLGPVVNILVNL